MQPGIAGGAPRGASAHTRAEIDHERTQRYVVDASGKRTGVLLDIREYERLLADAEELAAIRAYDAAKASGETPEPFEEAVARIGPQRR